MCLHVLACACDDMNNSLKFHAIPSLLPPPHSIAPQPNVPTYQPYHATPLQGFRCENFIVGEQMGDDNSGLKVERYLLVDLQVGCELYCMRNGHGCCDIYVM